MVFLQSLPSIRFITMGKAPGTLTGSFLPRQISSIPNGMRRKPTSDVISSLTIPLPCIFQTKKKQNLQDLNKIGFSVLASACLMQILKKQRDAVGLSIYSDQYEYYAPEKGSERHRRMLLHVLEETLQTVQIPSTNQYLYLSSSNSRKD